MFLTRISFCLILLLLMSRIARAKLLQQLAVAAQSMVQGGLSSTSRTCGKPSCACHSDPARRHGPNLYFTWRSQNKSYALYVPPQHAEQARAAQTAWAKFWEIAGQIAALNRQLLQKRWARAKQAATRAKVPRRTS